MSGGNFLGFSLPFGASNKPNPTATPGNPNPNFPANKQLDPKNPGADPNNQPNSGAADPANDGSNSADPNKGIQGSQLDSFKDFFTLPTDDKGNVVTPVDPMAGPLLTPDPAKLQAAAKKMNFAAGIDQDTLQKAMSGQDPTAFMMVLNTVAQNGFAAAMQANAGVVETAVNMNNQRFEKALPDRIRSTQINQTQAKHPALSHPAAAPVLAGLKMTVANSNPHLSPDKVAEIAENYLIAMSNDVNNVNMQQTQQHATNRVKETDWDALLKGN